MNSFTRTKYAFILALSMASLVSASASSAAVVEGITLPDTDRVANHELKLNGAGMRYQGKARISVIGLYLKDNKNTVPQVIALSGAKRVTIVLMRDFSNDTFAQAFMAGFQKNSDKSERAKVVNSLLKFGSMFSSVAELKKGDVITCDWIPNVGSVFALNGKKLGDALPDKLFYDMLLKIFIGDKPVDTNLKRLLLGKNEKMNPHPNY